MKKEIYYWSPFLGKVATVRSVINSMIGLKRYNGNKYKINLINCYGEWDNFKTRLKKKKIFGKILKLTLSDETTGRLLTVGQTKLLLKQI